MAQAWALYAATAVKGVALFRWRTLALAFGGAALLGVAIPPMCPASFDPLYQTGPAPLSDRRLQLDPAAFSIDRKFRALDPKTGKELWRADLVQGGCAVPTTYMSKRSGRQFVVIAAGGVRAWAHQLKPGCKLMLYR